MLISPSGEACHLHLREGAPEHLLYQSASHLLNWRLDLKEACALPPGPEVGEEGQGWSAQR